MADKSSAETEGVIKFELAFESGPPPREDQIVELNAWRQLLHRLGLTSRDPLRYGGLAFGNLSRRGRDMRIADPPAVCLITGTQTGGLPRLSPAHYCWVTGYDLAHNRLSACGPLPPSSEALTHVAIYHANASAECVIHVHVPEIWRAAETLALPSVSAGIAYGTPEMALAIAALASEKPDGVIAMLGHEDGILSYGDSIAIAATRLLETLVRAFALTPFEPPG